jgi:hypothetical protein
MDLPYMNECLNSNQAMPLRQGKRQIITVQRQLFAAFMIWIWRNNFTARRQFAASPVARLKILPDGR